jgi:hypothetical protein
VGLEAIQLKRPSIFSKITSVREIYSTGEMPMSDIDTKLNSDILADHLSKKDGLPDLIENVLNQALEHQNN